MSDQTNSGVDVLIPPNPDAPKDTPPKSSGRPTTRAGRAAAKAAREAKGDGADKAPKKGTPAPRKATLENRLANSITTLGMGVAAAGAMTSPAVQADGVLIIGQAPALSKALADLAAQDTRVARNLERMLTAGVYGGIVSACVPLVVGMAANHGVIPEAAANALGVELPDVPRPEPVAQQPQGAGAAYGAPAGYEPGRNPFGIRVPQA